MLLRRSLSIVAMCIELLLCALSTFAQPVPLANAVLVQRDQVLVRPGEDWSAQVNAPGREGDKVLLWLQARLHLEGDKGGGCNWALRVFIDDQVLSETVSRPRLLNKPPSFDFAGGKYHFSWFSHNLDAWMMLFSDTYDVNTAGTGQDTAFFFDITDYVRPGQQFRLRLAYALPQLPAILKRDAPIAVRDIVVGNLTAEAVNRLREAVLGSDGSRRKLHIATIPDANEPAAEPPYEIAWAKRPERPPAQVSFENLAGWQATSIGDVQVELAASRAQRIWRKQVLAIRITPGKNFVLELRPPKPIPIPPESNAVNAWIYSNHSYGASGSPVEVSATIVDSAGICLDLPMGLLRGDYWEMRQGLASADRLARLRPPLYFDSVTLSSNYVAKPMIMYLESLAFFKRVRKPYSALGRLSHPRFPTTEDNMLPPSPPDCATTANLSADQRTATFVSKAPTGVLTYTIEPRDGGLCDVIAQFADGPRFRPMAGAGVRIVTPAGTVNSLHAKPRLLSCQFDNGIFTTRWSFRTHGVTGEYTVSYRLRGRTLIVDVACPGGVAEGVSLGKVQGLPQLKGIEVPYLVFDYLPSPRIAMGGSIFVSVLVDWYHSNCSIIETMTAEDEPDDEGLCINTGTLYERLSNGRRNDLADRILVTVSPDIHDTLPTVATPRSEKIEELAPAMFVMSSDFTPAFYHTLKRYGLDHVIAIHFAGIWWTRAGEGFAMRWKPRPDLTEQDVADYRADIKSLGYLWGMLVNYSCFFPLNEHWDENLVALTPSGQLADGWYGHYETKPNATARLARIVGEKIRARYPTDCVYLDCHTNYGSRASDYEAGVEGAGTARGSILANAECIWEVHKQHGAVCSEGIRRWMYAGLSDMDYAQWVGREKPQAKPLLPDFDLLRIHPKQIGTAMGYSPSCFFHEEGLKEYYADPGKGTSHKPFYHYVAAILAHGHSAMVGYGYFPSLARTIHYYSLLSGPQEDYLPDTVSEIAWYDEKTNTFVSTSQALHNGARDDGKLRVTYRGGQLVYVNYHPEKTWSVEIDGRQFLLPPYGWLIIKPRQIFAYSALIDGRRVDYVDCPRYVYLNSGDGAASEGPVTVDGAVLIKKTHPIVVVPCGDLGPWKTQNGTRYPMFRDMILAGAPADRGVRFLRLDVSQLARVSSTASVTVAYRDEDGATIKTETMPANNVVISPSADVVDYAIR